MSDKVILSMKNLVKQFNPKEGRIVNDFSLDVFKGEIIGLLGESGSGKSTILRMIAGLEIPDSGEIIINNHRVFGSNKFVEPERRNVGMVFQDYALFPHLTVKDNILYGFKNKSKKEKKEKLDFVLSLIKMNDLSHRYPHELSGGQKQRVALARALAPEPDILLLDEPFNSLDISIQMEIRKQIYELLKQTSTTALFVSHDKKDAFYLTDRTAIIKDGKIQQLGTPKALYDSPENLYVSNYFGDCNVFKTDKLISLNGNMSQFLYKLVESHSENGLHTYIARPEDIEIIDSQDSIKCHINNIIYYGDHIEIKVTPIIESNDTIKTELTIFSHSGNNFNEKSFIKIKPKVNSIKKLDI